MGYLLCEMQKSELPRERLKARGAGALANHELLAILLQTGTKESSVLTVAQQVLKNYANISLLTEATIEELMLCKGIGEAKAITLLAAIELGKRVLQPICRTHVISTPRDAYLYLKDQLEHLNQEHVICLFLDIKSQVITSRTIGIGNIQQTVIDPKDIMKWALKHSSLSVLLAHNHPSGIASPSKADFDITKKVQDALFAMDMKLIDHIIVGKNQYYSFQEKRICRIQESL